jgi:hypothetical protein
MIAQLKDFAPAEPTPLLLGQREALPYRYWFDDFEPVEVPYLIVSRNIPQAGWAIAEGMESHFKILFGLGYTDEEEEDI